MYIVKLYYSKRIEMEDIILCGANSNNLNKVFHSCVDEIQKHIPFHLTVNGLEATTQTKELYLKIYVEKVDKNFKNIDKIKDLLSKVNNS